MRRLIRLAVGVCGILAVAATTAWATGLLGDFVGSDGSITACVHNNDGNVRFLDLSSTSKDLQSCKNDETQVTFNQKGQKGDTGPQGPPGPPGPAGTLTSASQLEGLACTTDAGANGHTVLSFDSAGNAALRCDTGGSAGGFCGDTIVQPQNGEQCDSGGVNTSTCDGSTCRISICGNGYVNPVAGEQCDTGGADTASCVGLTCRISVCGDQYVNFAAGEQCDDGNSLNGDGCSSTCRYETSPPP